MPMELGPQREGKRLVLNVEIFRAGSFADSSGEVNEWTIEHLDSMVRAFKSGLLESVPIKLGHTSDEFVAEVAAQMGVAPLALTGDKEGQGQAALGEVFSLSRHGNLLVADFLAAESVVPLIQQGLFRAISSEILSDFRGFSAVLSGVALLGAEQPAVKGLSGLSAATLLKEARAAAVLTFSLEAKQEDTLEDLKKFQSELEAKLKVKKHQSPEEMLDLIGRIMGAMEELGSMIADGGGPPEGEGKQPAPEDMAAKLKAYIEGQKTASFAEGKKAGARDGESHFTEQLKARDERITKLERENRINRFARETALLTAVEGKPEEMAAQLADMDEKAAGIVLASWKKQQEFAEKSGLFKPIGDGRPGAPSDLEPTAEETSIAAKVGVSREELIEQKAIKFGRPVPDSVATVLAERRKAVAR